MSTEPAGPLVLVMASANPDKAVEIGEILGSELGDGVVVFGSLVHTESLRNATAEERVVHEVGLSWQRPGGFNVTIGWEGSGLSEGDAAQQVFRVGLHLPF